MKYTGDPIACEVCGFKPVSVVIPMKMATSETPRALCSVCHKIKMGALSRGEDDPLYLAWILMIRMSETNACLACGWRITEHSREYPTINLCETCLRGESHGC